MSEAAGWDDDEMDDLFSFGTDQAAVESKPEEDAVLVGAASTQRERAGSDDSFLDLLDEETKNASTFLSSTVDDVPTSNTTSDKEAQDLLNWLDKDDEKPEEKEDSKDEEMPLAVEPTVVAIPEPEKPKPPVFDTLEKALKSSESSIDIIRELTTKQNMKVEAALRPSLWIRMVTNKTLENLQDSSITDSYTKWKDSCDLTTYTDEFSTWIQQEAKVLAARVTCMPHEEAAKELTYLLLFHYQQRGDNKEQDPLVPPVACTILSAGIPASCSSAVLSQIMPSCLPLLALTRQERMEPARFLHTHFYLLACYHLPLLVFHLDRHIPGWYWPKQLSSDVDENKSTWRNLEAKGVIPQSWLISHLAGECGGTFMNPKWLLSVWDLVLTSSNNSLRFFLSIAVLEKHSDSLLMLTGTKLVEELNRIVEFREAESQDGFAIEAEEETTTTEAADLVKDWCDRAKALWDSTPRSVVCTLRKSEDEAVTQALMERQRKVEAALKAKLEAEAKAHAEAMEAEKEKREAEARARVNKARLSLYYKQFNPERAGNVDSILTQFDGRLDILDYKLKAKYGQSFNPVLKPAPASAGILQSMNIGLTAQRKRFSQAIARPEEETVKKNDSKGNVALKVSPDEVLPIICWSKETDVLKKASNRPNDALKFYLVDSRPADVAQEQGSFPTALPMSPEALMDPDLMKERDEMFESLRGAAHIVIMGEGFSSVPSLYNLRVTPQLQNLINEDESRTSLCALYFVKKGFPFVSVLEGGFCSAHSWLHRTGPSRHLYPHSVLVDYAGSTSVFGELEKTHREQESFAGASTAEKASRISQSILDKSLVSLTRNAQRLEKLAKAPEPRAPIQVGSAAKSPVKSPVATPKAMPVSPANASSAPTPAPQPTIVKQNFTPPAEESTQQSDGTRDQLNRFAAFGASKLSNFGSALNKNLAKMQQPNQPQQQQQQQQASGGGGGGFGGFGAALKKLPGVGQVPQQRKQQRFGIKNFPVPPVKSFGLPKVPAGQRQPTASEEETVIDFN